MSLVGWWLRLEFVDDLALVLTGGRGGTGRPRCHGRAEPWSGVSDWSLEARVVDDRRPSATHHVRIVDDLVRSQDSSALQAMALRAEEELIAGQPARKEDERVPPGADNLCRERIGADAVGGDLRSGTAELED